MASRPALPARGIPGGRLAAESPAKHVRLALGAGWFLGPWGRRLSRAGRRNDPGRVHLLERRWAAGVSRFLDIRWDVAGLEHLTGRRRSILLPLHEGLVDVVALFRLGLDLRFVARDELLDWTTLGRYLRDTDQVLIDPEQGRRAFRQLLERGSRVLDAGEALVIFPQGSILGVEVAFRQGAFQLAERVGAWIVPVVITGSHRVWEYPYSPLVRFGQRISVRVLPPVPPHEAGNRARAVEREMKQVALEPSLAPARRFRPEIDGFWDDYRFEIDPAFPDLSATVASHRESLDR